MQTKLTLNMDEETIKRAKKYARKRGTSVSRLVANYLMGLDRFHIDIKESDLPPITRKLLGSLKGAKDDENSYKEYLVRKYG